MKTPFLYFYVLLAAFAVTAGTISYHPITGDADSGISSARNYTHAIDFGNQVGIALINGVQFGDGDVGAFPGETGSQTIGTGASNNPTGYAANTGANAFLTAPPNGMRDLVNDFIYNDSTSEVTLTGLTPGAHYQFRLYHRVWGGDRRQNIGFDTDGSGGGLAGSEDTATFDADNANSPDVSLPGDYRQVYAFAYDYVLTGGATTLTVYINQIGAGTYHMYGLSNEKVSGPPNIVTMDPQDGTTDFGGNAELSISFDEVVQKGTGNIVIKRTADNSTFETIDVSSSRVSLSGTDVTIDPFGTMQPGVGYYVQIDAGAIENTGNEDFAGIADTMTWNFSVAAITFVPISGDADSGISSAKTYTHAIDFGSNTVATVNGVEFGDGNQGAGGFPGPTGAQTVGTGSSNLGSIHGGNSGAVPFSGQAINDLLHDMIFNAAAGVVTLTGLTPGANYQFRLYQRAWVAGANRRQSIEFDTDGLAGAEHSAIFNADDASEADPSFAAAAQVYAFTYDYTLSPGVTSLTVNINQTGTGSYHMYGLSNEKVSGAPTVVSLNPPDDTTNRLVGNGDLTITFDEAVQKGTGNIVIKRTADDSIFETIDVTSAKVSTSGKEASINPSGILLNGVGYYVQIASGAFENLAGEDYAGIADTTSWNFVVSPISFVPINGDGDSGFNSAKTYTHLLDFGDNSGSFPEASINGVEFGNGSPGAFPGATGSQTVGTGSSNVPTSHPGHPNANPYLDGAAFANMENLVGDFTYGSTSPEITLTGLTPGQPYQFKLYNRPFTISTRSYNIDFDTDGVPGAEHSASFNEDNSSDPDANFALDWQVNALTYNYTPTSTQLTINMTHTGGDSYHFYGLSNEQLNPPSITSLDPADGETGVSLVGYLTMTFLLDVVKGTGNIEIRKTADDSLVETIDVNSAAVTVSGNTITIDPSVTLAVSTDYYVLIDVGAITSEPGIAFGISSTTDWNFETAAVPDTTPPFHIALSPGNNSDSVVGSTDLAITFNEFVQRGTGNILIRRASDDAIVETIGITDSNVSISGATVSIDRSTSLATNTDFYIQIAATAIEDLSGNAFAGISNTFSWAFMVSGITYEPITGDADSDISSAKTYTHALDFGTGTVATVNGVVFGDGNPGAFPGATGSQTVGTGSSTLPNNHGGNGSGDLFLSAGGMRELVRDMIFGDTTGLITLTGLTPGQKYKVRLYNRAFGTSAGTRGQSIGFDTDGIGTTISDAEATGHFFADDASRPDANLATATTVNALTYSYTLPAGVTQLRIYINSDTGNTYHFYGISNEEVQKPTGTVFRFR